MTGRALKSADPHQRWLRRLIGYCWRHPRNLTLALAGSLFATLIAVSASSRYSMPPHSAISGLPLAACSRMVSALRWLAASRGACSSG